MDAFGVYTFICIVSHNRSKIVQNNCRLTINQPLRIVSNHIKIINYPVTENLVIKRAEVSTILKLDNQKSVELKIVRIVFHFTHLAGKMDFPKPITEEMSPSWSENQLKTNNLSAFHLLIVSFELTTLQ